MARQAIHARRSARTVLAGGLGAAALALMVGVAPALAASEPPVWVPITFAEPTHLQPGSPRNAVQMWKVDATGGTYTITIKTRECQEGATTEAIPYNATHEQLETALEEMSCEFGSSTPGFVTGGPGGPGGGTPYRIEYTGEYLGDRSDTALPTFNTAELTGGGKSGSAENTVEGEKEGAVIVSATNVGGTTDGTKVTIEDTLPSSLTPTSVSGVDAYLSESTDEGKGSTEMLCSPIKPAEPVRCTIEGAEIITGDTLIMEIHVKAANVESEDEVNNVTVSGGGGEPASIGNPLVISSEKAGYGPVPGGVVAGLSTNQAGAHASVTTGFTMDTDEFGHVAGPEKDIRFDLPPGLVGNATQLPKCTIANVLAQLENGFSCPAASMVGMVTLYINLVPDSAPIGFTTPLYAITPAPGEPVAFAFDALLLPVRLDTSVRSNGDYGVRVTAPSLSEAAETFSNWITLWGVPADHNGPPANAAVPRKDIYSRPFGGPEPGEQRQPFLTSPQECGKSMEVIMSTDPWTSIGSFVKEPTTIPALVGCEALTMQPSFTMLPDTLEAGAPAGYTLNLTVPQNGEPDSLATPTIRDVKLALPVGTVVSPSLAWGLKACSESQFGLHSGALSECPREAQVGEVEIESPDLPEKLVGQVFLANPQCSHNAEGQELCTPENAQNGEMVRLYVQAVSQGESKIIVKLEGRGSINQATGQITTTFENSPPLPFNKFVLKLGGGPRAALANQRHCGPATTTMDLTPWSTPFTEDSNPFYSFEIKKNCFGEQFNPTLVAGTTSIQSGEYSAFTLSFGRSDDEGFLAGLQEQLPPGLLGRIAGLTLCPEPQAAEGKCGPNSLIGHVQALTGPGADPFLVTNGEVFLTGGYKGAPFGLSIVVPAVAGPYALAGTNGKGDVVVRAAINVDKEDAHLTITSDPLPTELDGIPLQIKVLNVNIDRKEFTFNPTSCERMNISNVLTSQEGQIANVQTPFQVTNCVGLGFNPKFEVSTSGQTSRADGASLDAKLIYPLGKKLANVKNVRVELPKQLPSRLTTLQQACPDHVFNENPESCPAASRIGQARASTPVLPNELEGWAYFVSHGGAAFPNLVVVLQDRPDGVRVDLVGETFISKAGITSTTFGTVPDVPISEFELYLPEGPNSALAANGNLCQSVLKMPTEFHGQNGGVLKQSTPIGVSGCSTKAAKANKARRARRARAAAAHHHNKHKKKHAKKARGASRHAANGRGN